MYGQPFTANLFTADPFTADPFKCGQPFNAADYLQKTLAAPPDELIDELFDELLDDDPLLLAGSISISDSHFVIVILDPFSFCQIALIFSSKSHSTVFRTPCR